MAAGPAYARFMDIRTFYYDRAGHWTKMIIHLVYYIVSVSILELGIGEGLSRRFRR